MLTDAQRAAAVINALAPTCPQCGRPTRMADIGGVHDSEACFACAKWVWNSREEACELDAVRDNFEAYKHVALFRDDF